MKSEIQNCMYALIFVNVSNAISDKRETRDQTNEYCDLVVAITVKQRPMRLLYVQSIYIEDCFSSKNSSKNKTNN